MNYDYLIKNGNIVDGSGSPAFEGSLAISAGKIAKLLHNQDDISAIENKSKEVIDASGLIVCPGFIDMHSHADWVLPLPDHPSTLAPLLEQGITTVVGGNCGYSTAPLAPRSLYLDLVASESEFIADKPLNFEWSTMASFFEHLEHKGLALNLGMLVGHGNLRLSMFGQPDVCPGEQGFAEMVWAAGEALKEGACGISLGLGYSPGIFSDISELERFAVCAREHNRLLTVHLKAYTKLSGAYPLKLIGNQPHNVRALEEMINLARCTGVKLQISHLLFVGRSTWPLADRCLELIENAVADGVDLAFDSFPYSCGNTTIYIAYPTWFRDNIEKNFKSKTARMRVKLEIKLISSQLGFGLEDIQILWGGTPELDQFNGLFFDEIAKQMGTSTIEAYLQVSEKSKGKTLCLLHKYNGEESNMSVLDRVVCHPLNMVETDTILTTRGLQNPSSFGTFPRVIQRYCKEIGALSLEEAIAKITAKPAERFGLSNRGKITEGNWADITIFDYDEIADNTTLRELENRPSGIKHVLLNGTAVVQGGIMIKDVKAGQALRVC
jgi:N-acyl-D-amino-acid deacylase